MQSRRLFFAIATLLASSCAGPQAAVEPAPDLASLVGPGTRQPQSELERALLPKLGEQPEGGTVAVAGRSVQLGPVYAAASGRRCRLVSVADADNAAAACQVDGAWAFVPRVVNVERGPT